MHCNIKLIVTFCLMVFSSASVADPIPQTFQGMYLGMSGSQDRMVDSDNTNIVGAMFKFGYDFNKVIGLEAHMGATTTKSFILVDQQGQAVGEYKVRGRHAGVYARANWRMTNITLYGLLGVAYYKRVDDVNVPGAFSDTSSSSKTGLSYGVGLDLFGNSQTALSLNWMQLINKDFFGYGEKTRINAIQLGITYYFAMQKTNHPVNPRDRLDHY